MFTAACWKAGIAKVFENPPPEGNAVVAVSGSLTCGRRSAEYKRRARNGRRRTLFPAVTCVAPTAVT